MNSKDIDTLITLYKEKNITKTSEKLYISQPALTKRIKKIEEEFNTPIIIRTTRGIVFTPQGEKLIGHLQYLKTRLQYIKDDVSSIPDEVQGTLRLGVSTIFAHYELPDLLKGYLEKYPKVELSIQADNSSKIYRLLQSDEISAGIIRGDYSWNDERKHLSTEPLCIAYYKAISLNALSNLTYIQYQTDPFLQYQLEQWWNERDIKPKVGITTSSINTCLELVKNGIGWSILPYMGLKKFNGYVEKLFWKDSTPFDRSTWIYYKKDHSQLSTVSSFIDFIESKNFNNMNI